MNKLIVKNYTLILLVLFLSSCCKAIFETKTLYSNTTDNNIEIRTYNKGEFNTSFIDAKSVTIASFISYDYGISVDSLRLFINGVYQQTHYAAGIKKSVSSNVVLFEDAKNLLNFANYQMTIKKLSCDGRQTTYTYSF